MNAPINLVMAQNAMNARQASTVNEIMKLINQLPVPPFGNWKSMIPEI
jgi:hypothetical protein